MNSASLRIALLALACLAAPAQAQLYKWVDSSGRVQYSDRKPPDGKQQSQEVKSTVSSVGSQSGAAGGGQSVAERDKEFQKRREELAKGKQKQQLSATEQKRKSEGCDEARRNLAGLQSGQRIARYDTKGEMSYLDDSGRASEIARTQKLVEQNCK